jgi:hypothetical protein
MLMSQQPSENTLYLTDCTERKERMQQNKSSRNNSINWVTENGLILIKDCKAISKLA